MTSQKMKKITGGVWHLVLAVTINCSPGFFNLLPIQHWIWFCKRFQAWKYNMFKNNNKVLTVVAASIKTGIW